LAAALERLTTLESQLTELTRELARDVEDPILNAQQSAIARQYSVAFEQSDDLATSPPVIGFTTLERAQAVETTDRGLGAPTSRASRALLGAIVGAALGLGLAMLLGLADRRIRSKEQAEGALGLRAQVLIPKVRGADRDQLVIRANRHDPLTDAYRTVRNVVSFTHGQKEPDGPARVTLVVSPSAGDGKTSLSANLAAALAEAGQRTVIINADFRRPRLSTVFGPDAEQPLPFMLEDVEILDGTAMLNRTGIDRLRVLDLSNVDAPAGELVRATVDKLEGIAHVCDHIIIDTSPIGATAEVLDLVPYADAIVMTLRIGNSTVQRAQRSVALLRDLTSVPMLLVLGGMKAEKSEYDEYSDDRVKPARTPRRRWRRSSATKGDGDVASEDLTNEDEFQLDLDSVE
jgi:Mrp family chromosome partitioning ATPase